MLLAGTEDIAELASVYHGSHVGHDARCNCVSEQRWVGDEQILSRAVFVQRSRQELCLYKSICRRLGLALCDLYLEGLRYKLLGRISPQAAKGDTAVHGTELEASRLQFLRPEHFSMAWRTSNDTNSALVAHSCNPSISLRCRNLWLTNHKSVLRHPLVLAWPAGHPLGPEHP